MTAFGRCVLVVILTTTSLVGCSGKNTSPGGTVISGTVSADGSLVKEATITLHFDMGKTWGATVQNGRFSGRCLQSGAARVCVESQMTVVPKAWASAATSPLTVSVRENDTLSFDVNLSGNGFEVGASPEPSQTKVMPVR